MAPDNRLDVVVSLVAFGSYPNVCFHKEKRKILTTEGRNALIHKSSVNCPFSSQDISYPSPFFVFGEKVLMSPSPSLPSTFTPSSVHPTLVASQIRTRAVSAKGMTLVSPLQLLLFACKKITSDGDVVELDDWCTSASPMFFTVSRKGGHVTFVVLLVSLCRIKLRMDHEAAGCVAALRATLEALVVEVSKDPEYIRQMDVTNQRLLDTVRHVSKPSAVGLNLVSNNQR